MMKGIGQLGLAVAAILVTACSQGDASAAPEAEATSAQAAPTRQETMEIKITANGRQMTATLEDSAAARDFVAMLPLELNLRDYHGTEKIADLPSRLSQEGAPDGVNPAVGDIAYYAPWGNLAIFYRDFGYSKGLIRLGRIVDDIDILEGRDDVPVHIDLQ